MMPLISRPTRAAPPFGETLEYTTGAANIVIYNS